MPPGDETHQAFDRRLDVDGRVSHEQRLAMLADQLQDPAAAAIAVQNNLHGLDPNLWSILGEHLHRHAATDRDQAERAAVWLHRVAAKNVAFAAAWVSHPDHPAPQEHQADLILRLCGSLGTQLRAFHQKVTSVAGHQLRTTDPLLGNRSVPAHDFAVLWPNPLTDDPVPTDLPKWLVDTSWAGSGVKKLGSRLREVVRGWTSLVAEGHPQKPASLVDALVTLRTLELPGPGAHSAFGAAYAQARADARDFEPTFASYLKGFSVPRLPLPLASVTHAGYTGRFVSRDDPTGLLLGSLTHCCQHVGGVGEYSAVHGQENPRGGFLAIEDSDGNVIGQSWVWLDPASRTWCLDNIELRESNDDDDIAQLSTRERTGLARRHENIAELYKQMGAKLAQHTGIPVTVGVSYTPRTLVTHFQKIKAEQYADVTGLGYTDADKQRLVAEPDSNAEHWSMLDGQDAAPGSSVTWRHSDGTTVRIQRTWDGGTPVRTTVQIVEPLQVDDLPDHVHAFAASVGGYDHLTILDHENTVLVEYEATGVPAEELIGPSVTREARHYAQEFGTDTGRILAMLTQPGDLAEVLSTSDFTAHDILEFADYAPLTALAVAVRAGVTRRDILAYREAGLVLPEVCYLLQRGVTRDDLTVVHEKSTLANLVSFLQMCNDFDWDTAQCRDVGLALIANDFGTRLRETPSLLPLVNFDARTLVRYLELDVHLHTVGVLLRQPTCEPADIFTLVELGLPLERVEGWYISGGTTDEVVYLASQNANLHEAGRLRTHVTTDLSTIAFLACNDVTVHTAQAFVNSGGTLPELLDAITSGGSPNALAELLADGFSAADATAIALVMRDANDTSGTLTRRTFMSAVYAGISREELGSLARQGISPAQAHAAHVERLKAEAAAHPVEAAYSDDDIERLTTAGATREHIQLFSLFDPQRVLPGMLLSRRMSMSDAVSLVHAQVRLTSPVLALLRRGWHVDVVIRLAQADVPLDVAQNLLDQDVDPADIVALVTDHRAGRLAADSTVQRAFVAYLKDHGNAELFSHALVKTLTSAEDTATQLLFLQERFDADVIRLMIAHVDRFPFAPLTATAITLVENGVTSAEIAACIQETGTLDALAPTPSQWSKFNEVLPPAMVPEQRPLEPLTRRVAARRRSQVTAATSIAPQ